MIVGDEIPAGNRQNKQPAQVSKLRRLANVEMSRKTRIYQPAVLSGSEGSCDMQ